MSNDNEKFFLPAGAKIELDAGAFNELWAALNGPDYLVRELQATRDIDILLAGNPGHKPNPLNVLGEDYEKWFEQFRGKTSYYWTYLPVPNLAYALVEGLEVITTKILMDQPVKARQVFYSTRQSALQAIGRQWEQWGLSRDGDYLSYALLCVIADDYKIEPYTADGGATFHADRRIKAEHILSTVQILRYSETVKAE